MILRLTAVFVVLWALPLLAATSFESWLIGQINPTVFWFMDETSGTALTNSGAGGAGYNLGTINTPTLNQAGVNAARGVSINWASASTEYAEVNKNDTGTGPGDFGTDRSWSCWIKNTGAATGTLVSVADSQAGGQVNRNGRMAVANSAGNKAFFQIYQNIGTTSYISVTGATSMTDGVWYMITGTWATSGTTIKVYLNATEDGTNSTTLGLIADATTWIAVGRQEGSADVYFNGNIQDCFMYTSLLSAAQVSAIYNRGILIAAQLEAWPFTVKRPELPRFRDDGYFAKAINRGYVSGGFHPTVMHARAFGPYLPLAVVPNGKGR